MDLLTWSDIIIQIVLCFLFHLVLNVHLASMENYLTQQSA